MPQAAGLAAVKDASHLEMSVRKLKEHKQQLVSDLVTLGLKPQPSDFSGSDCRSPESPTEVTRESENSGARLRDVRAT